jgi:hypothetical protein
MRARLLLVRVFMSARVHLLLVYPLGFPHAGLCLLGLSRAKRLGAAGNTREGGSSSFNRIFIVGLSRTIAYKKNDIISLVAALVIGTLAQL